jgi:hypothetical protein
MRVKKSRVRPVFLSLAGASIVVLWALRISGLLLAYGLCFPQTWGNGAGEASAYSATRRDYAQYACTSALCGLTEREEK